LLTLEDVDFLIHILTAVDPEYPVTKGDAVAERLKDLKKLWSKEGLPVVEVDIYLMGEVPGRFQRTQIHTFAVDDIYKLLPEDEDPEIPADGWKVQDIRATSRTQI
jgi:hypothetical protein